MIGAWSKVRLTATGPAVNHPCEFGGVICQAAGTSTTVTVYDDASAVANNLTVPTSATLSTGDFVSPMKSVAGNGIIHTKGIYVTIGGTGSPSVWVLYR